MIVGQGIGEDPIKPYRAHSIGELGAMEDVALRAIVGRVHDGRAILCHEV